MSNIPTITEKNIRALVDEASFVRGQNYFHGGNIFDTRRQGMTLKARCQGSRPQPYRVQVTLLDYLRTKQNNQLLIQIALDEGDIDKALELVKTGQSSGQAYAYGYSYGYGYSSIALEVARAAEETHPRESIEIYRKHVERLIDQRGRGSYQQACQYLLRMRDLYKKLGEQVIWTAYITELRDKNRNLRALKEELAAAGLI